MERITSRSNALLTHIRRLASSGGYRRQCGEYLGDSPKLLQEALAWGAELVAVVCGDGVELPPLPASDRQTLCRAGGSAGPRQRGHRPAHAGRL